MTGAPLKSPQIGPAVLGHQDHLAVRISAADLCGRFSGRIVRNVNPRAKTPNWMHERLARCGQRSVAVLVDISNYVMFELGRPSHIFDLERIRGGLEVRWGRSGESLKLLNGSTVEVDADVGVIADAERVESLAGIMSENPRPCPRRHAMSTLRLRSGGPKLSPGEHVASIFPPRPRTDLSVAWIQNYHALLWSAPLPYCYIS